jgi:hypothetical protein
MSRLAGEPLLLAAALLVAACTEDPIGPPAPGRLVVSTLTRGDDPDPDGYQLAIDGGAPTTLLTNDADTLVLEPGRHTVVLQGVSEHCAVDPGHSQAMDVVPGGTATLAFEIACPLTGIQVLVSTTGGHLDPDGYQLTVDGTDHGHIGSVGSRLVKGLSPGPHAVSLSDVEANCTPAETSRSVTVLAEAVEQVEFAVTCVAPVGTLRVAAPTTGPARGPYRVFLWYGHDPWWFYDGYIDLGELPANGVLSTQAAAGVYWVELSVDPLCSVSVPNPTSAFTLDHGSVVEVEFPVSCAEESW